MIDIILIVKDKGNNEVNVKITFITLCYERIYL